MKKYKTMKAWAGFTDGQIISFWVDDGFGGYGKGTRVAIPTLYKSKKEAMKRFYDVRRVEIHIVPQRNGK